MQETSTLATYHLINPHYHDQIVEFVESIMLLFIDLTIKVKFLEPVSLFHVSLCGQSFLRQSR